VELAVFYISHHIIVMRLGLVGFKWGGTFDLTFTVSSGIFWPFSPTGTQFKPSSHSSETLVEWYLNGSQVCLGNF
jgi:hypothetical protein